MEVEIRPEPGSTERRALLAALEHASLSESVGEPYQQAWRVAALREAVDDENADVGYAFPPRSTRGATRA
jgi:hypothetical protein